MNREDKKSFLEQCREIYNNIYVTPFDENYDGVCNICWDSSKMYIDETGKIAIRCLYSTEENCKEAYNRACIEITEFLNLKKR